MYENQILEDGTELEFVYNPDIATIGSQCISCAYYHTNGVDCPGEDDSGLICNMDLTYNWQPVKFATPGQTKVETLSDLLEKGKAIVENWPDVEPQIGGTETAGKKYDTGKQRYDLIPALALDEVVRGLTAGAEKYNEAYDEENWRKVDYHDRRYFGALQRHSWAVRRGEKYDTETNVHHYALAICNLMFLLEKELEQEQEFKDSL